MRVEYIFLAPGELPIFSIRSRNVHVWYPRDWPQKKVGWFRQSRPTKKSRSAVVPLLELKTPRFKRWLTEKVAMLESPKGAIFVAVRYADAEYLHVGVFHTTRPPREGLTTSGLYKRHRLHMKYPFLPATIRLPSSRTESEAGSEKAKAPKQAALRGRTRAARAPRAGSKRTAPG